MCNYSELIKEEGRAEGIEQGKLNTLISLVKDGLLPTEEAAKRTGMTIEDFRKLVNA